MKKDPIVEEIRKIRQAHAAKFNYDLKAISLIGTNYDCFFCNASYLAWPDHRPSPKTPELVLSS